MDEISLEGKFDLNTEQGRVEMIRYRVNRMSNAKSFLNSKFQLQKQIYEVFEQHLTRGEVWNQPYRFPEVFGSLQRKLCDLIDALPEVKIRATKPKAKDFTIASQAIYNQQENLGNARAEKIRCLFDSLMCGTGILYEGYGRDVRNIMPTEDGETDLPYSKSKMVSSVLYDGLISRRIDPRDFYLDDTAYVIYDETGSQGAADAVVRRIYSKQEWQAKFKDFKNFDKVAPVAWGVSMITAGKQPFPKEAQEQKTSNQYYEVLEYWNKELDLLVLVSNTVEIYVGANPFKHKRLPFVAYYNYRRDDSFWGVSETEVIVPYVQAKEEVNNLRIMDAKLKLQPALAVAGGAQFNEEENELQPGAIFTLRGVVNGKVGDAVMPLSFGGIDPNSSTIIDSIENDRIAATGDDTRALYSNPGQLATQTLAKRDAAQKRIKSNILQNTLDSERHRAQMRFSNIVQFIARPYQTTTGKVQFRKVNVEGYNVRQDSDDGKVYFEQKYGAQGCFAINEKIFKGMDDSVEIEVVDVQMQEQLKSQEVDDALRLVEIAAKFPQMLQEMNPVGLIKQVAKKMNIDYYEVFPEGSGEETMDPIEIMLDLLIMGETPDYNGELNPEEIVLRLRNFKKSSMYKKMAPKLKINFNNFAAHVTGFIPEYLKQKLASVIRIQTESFLRNTGQLPFGRPAQGVSQVSGSNVPGGAQNISEQNAPGQALVPGAEGVQSRLGFGPSQSA